MIKRKTITVAAVLAGILIFDSAAFLVAGDWPQFRGTSADGQVLESDVPFQWKEGKGVVWRTELPGPGASSPIIYGGHVFLTCYSGYGISAKDAGDQKALRRHALCYDLVSGKLLWNHEVSSQNKETVYTGRYITTHGYASSTPVTDGEHVYFFLGASGVKAYSLTGKLVWEKEVGNGVHDWGSGASPILYKNLLIVNASAESDALVALDKRTGERVWEQTAMPRAWNTPLLVDAGGDSLELVISVRGKIRGLDPATGKELWSCAGIKAAELCPSPISHEGTVFILGHPSGQAMAVRAGGRGDVTDSHVLWRLNKGSNVGSPIYHQEHLYWANDKRGIVYCVKADSGEIVYEERMTPRSGLIYASPIIVNDRIYYVSRQNGTFVVRADTKYQLLEHNVIGGDPSPFTGSPAVADGKLLLRSDRYLYCLGDN